MATYNPASLPVTAPLAAASLLWSATGTATTTGDTTVTSAAPGAGLRKYITWWAFGNSDTATVARVNIKSASTTVVTNIPVPTSGGNNMALPTPLPCGVNESVTLNVAAGGATVSLTVGGFIGT